MNSLLYLIRTEIKNEMKELLRKPGKLILYLFIMILIGASLLSTLFSGVRMKEVLDSYWLRGIYFAFTTMFLVIAIQKGVISGDTIFDMNDVNLMFVSPLNPRMILMYGLVRLVKLSFLAGFFILFQGNTLSGFGVDIAGVFVLFFLFMLDSMMLSIVSLVIYSVSNGSRWKKMAVKILALLIHVPLVIYSLLQLTISQDPAEAMEKICSSIFLKIIPVSGWTAAGAVELLMGDPAAGLLWIGLLLLFGAGMLAYIILSRSDYYEDVLVATETAFEKKRAVQEGDIQAVSAGSVSTVKIKKTGISGAGASSFLYKHIRETFRQERFGFFSLYNVIMLVCILAGVILSDGEIDVMVILQILMWMQIFMIGNGRGLREVYTHYIYMIPESPFSKVLWSNMEIVFKTLLESFFYLGVPGIIITQNPLVVIGAMIVYTLFSMLLLGINYLSMRFTEVDISQGIMVMIYFLAVILIMLPGLAAAMIVGFFLGGTLGLVLGLLILAVWELAAAMLCFYLSRNVLHSCDIQTMKQAGK